MAIYTTNYGLKKPNLEDYTDVRDMNRNMDILDSALMKLSEANGGSTGSDNGSDTSYDDSELENYPHIDFPLALPDWFPDVLFVSNFPSNHMEITMAVMETMV